MSSKDLADDDWFKERTLGSSDSIFKVQSDWMMNSCLNFSSDMTGTYTRGFKAMAQMGIEAIRRTRSNHDTLIYPIVFCFRHHIELQLKQAIAHGFEFLGRKQRTLNVHEVDKLWFELRSVLKDVQKITYQYPDPREIKNAERVIFELAGLDPKGISFRYAKTREGVNSIDRDLRILNLQSVSETLEKLSLFLDCVESQLHQFAEYKRDSESEIRSAGF